MRDRQFDVYRIKTHRNPSTKNLTFGLINTANGNDYPGAVVDLFSKSTGQNPGESKQPTGHSPDEKDQQHHGSPVNPVNPVNNSPDAYTHTRTQDNPEPAGELTGTHRLTGNHPHPDDDPSCDLADFDPQEEES